MQGRTLQLPRVPTIQLSLLVPPDPRAGPVLVALVALVSLETRHTSHLSIITPFLTLGNGRGRQILPVQDPSNKSCEDVGMVERLVISEGKQWRFQQKSPSAPAPANQQIEACVCTELLVLEAPRSLRVSVVGVGREE